MLSTLLIAAAQLSIGAIVLQPNDYLDGRTISNGTGEPVVLLTLTETAVAKVRQRVPTAVVKLGDAPIVARFIDNVIELDGQPDFKIAAATALAISGKPPLPDSLDE